MQNHMVGRRCRLTSGKNVGSDPNHGRPVGFAMLWLWNGEGHVSFQAEQCSGSQHLSSSARRPENSFVNGRCARAFFVWNGPRRDGDAELPLNTSAFGRHRKIETQRMELSSSATSSCDHVTFQHNVFVFQRTRSCRVIRARIPRRRPCRVVSRSDRLSLAGCTCVLALGRALTLLVKLLGIGGEAKRSHPVTSEGKERLVRIGRCDFLGAPLCKKSCAVKHLLWCPFRLDPQCVIYFGAIFCLLPIVFPKQGNIFSKSDFFHRRC